MFKVIFINSCVVMSAVFIGLATDSTMIGVAVLFGLLSISSGFLWVVGCIERQMPT
jgi:hypothetical protein